MSCHRPAPAHWRRADEVFDLGTTGTCMTKKAVGAFVSLI